MSSSPIVYEGLTQLRFSDLDAYGHLSATKYIDIVGSSRLTILEQKFGQ
jgi:acyl-CoA thioesterase FadM